MASTIWQMAGTVELEFKFMQKIAILNLIIANAQMSSKLRENTLLNAYKARLEVEVIELLEELDQVETQKEEAPKLVMPVFTHTIDTDNEDDKKPEDQENQFFECRQCGNTGKRADIGKTGWDCRGGPHFACRHCSGALTKKDTQVD